MKFRELREDDAPAVLDAFLADPAMSRQGDVTDLASAQRYVGRFLSNPDDMRSLVATDEDDRLIAFAAVSVDLENLNGWTFYWANPCARGRGMTSALVRTLADRELTEGGLHRLELGYRANNPASGRVAANAGFVVEGREREKFLIDGVRHDVINCARLRSDPFPA